ncbi:MAG: endonuclease domain-containing protein [Gemmatimonadales bacterium]
MQIIGRQWVRAMKLSFARKLRRVPAPAEQQAWEILRGRRLYGLKFRRQQVIRGYIVDFYCPELALVLEIDGGVHDDPERALKDAVRSDFFIIMGLTVLRIRNDEVSRERLQGLLETNFPSLLVEREPGG